MIDQLQHTSPDASGSSSPDPSGRRLVSLDAFRGLAVLIMLLVNNLGSGDNIPSELRHATWHEPVHIADMAFPWFLLCVGTAIPFSFASNRRKGLSRWEIALRVLRRTAILLLLGAIIDSLEDGRFEIFTVGILQTIAISYLLSLALYKLSGRWRFSIAAVGLLGYWAAIRFIPVPGVGPGVFTEDHNLIIYLNQRYLDSLGLWGLTRIIPTTALVLMGASIGELLTDEKLGGRRKALMLLATGAALTVGGFLWNMDLPFNKWDWTPSYVLLAGGLGVVLLGMFYVVTDVWKQRRWSTALVVLGSNAILAYALPKIVKDAILMPLRLYLGGWGSVLAFIAVWWLILWILYRKRIFLRA